MEFCKTQTFFNLARSFAGECQAGMRYQLTAKAAMKARPHGVGGGKVPESAP